MYCFTLMKRKRRFMSGKFFTCACTGYFIYLFCIFFYLHDIPFYFIVQGVHLLIIFLRMSLPHNSRCLPNKNVEAFLISFLKNACYILPVSLQSNRLFETSSASLSSSPSFSSRLLQTQIFKESKL